MAEQTRLGLSATPSRPYAAFSAKTPAVAVAGKKWWDRNACVINIIMAEEEEWH